MESGFASTDHVLEEICALIHQARVDEAVSLYSRCQEDIGYPLINHVNGHPTLMQGVANVLYRARDYPKAALVCENLGEFEKAGVLYERADDFGLAAEMFSKIGKLERAAEMFEKNQNYKQAADLFIQGKNFERAAVNFERAVNHFLAGKLYFELGRLQKAMELLQKVSTSEHEFFDATEMITRILGQNGYPELAMRKLLSVLQDAAINKTNIALHARLGELYAQLGQVDDARRVFGDILSFDFQYGDVSARIKALDDNDVPAAIIQGTPLAEIPAPIELGDAAPAPAQIVSVMEGFDVLKNLPLFEELALAEMKSFFNICESVTFESGAVLVEQGQPGAALYILKSGAVDVFRVDGGTAHLLTTLSAGDHVGEMALIDDAPTSARVVVNQPTAVLRIDKLAFQKLLFSNDHMALRVYRVFVRTLCGRLRDTTGRLATR